MFAAPFAVQMFEAELFGSNWAIIVRSDWWGKSPTIPDKRDQTPRPVTARIIVELQLQDAAHQRLRNTRPAIVEKVCRRQVVVGKQLLHHGAQACIERFGWQAMRPGLGFERAALQLAAS
jgi:hypothetical protein